MKRCSKCLQEKSLEEFHKHREGKAGYRPDCKDCCSLRHKKFRMANKKSIVEKQRLWAQRNREHVNAKQRERSAENRDEYNKGKREWNRNNLLKRRAISTKWNRANKERLNAIVSQWKKENKALLAEQAMARYALKVGAIPKWANKCAIQNIYKLARQKTLETGQQWHVDHVVPLKSKLVCGLHVEHNLRVVPASENLEKNNRYWPDMPEPIHG